MSREQRWTCEVSLWEVSCGLNCRRLGVGRRGSGPCDREWTAICMMDLTLLTGGAWCVEYSMELITVSPGVAN